MIFQLNSKTTISVKKKKDTYFSNDARAVSDCGTLQKLSCQGHFMLGWTILSNQPICTVY